MKDVTSKVIISPRNATDDLFAAYRKGKEAKQRPGILVTDCPYNEETEAQAVLAWRYGWNGHPLPDDFWSKYRLTGRWLQ